MFIPANSTAFIELLFKMSLGRYFKIYLFSFRFINPATTSTSWKSSLFKV